MPLRPSTLFGLSTAFAIACGSRQAPTETLTTQSPEETRTPDTGNTVSALGEPETTDYLDLRGVFLSSSTDNKKTGVVGSLAVRHGSRRLPIDTVFKNGDAIQFEVSANRDGWIYVFHQPPTGDMTLLWPTEESGKMDNYIRSHESVLIPRGNNIVFDAEPGKETFYITIVPKPTEPRIANESLSPPAPEKRQSKTQGQSRKTQSKTSRKTEDTPPESPPSEAEAPVVPPEARYQIAVRSIKEITTRGVRVEPKGDDIYVYFALEYRDGSEEASVKFSLNHE